MAPAPTVHKGVVFSFELREVLSHLDNPVRSMHYTRREFDPASNRARLVTEPWTLATFPELDVTEDCKVSEEVTALIASGDDLAKCLAEIVQNAVDTTLAHCGAQQIGGWGDGFKMAVARCLRSGASLDVVTVEGCATTPCTALEARDGAALLAQNSHPTRKFTDASLYVGWSDKPKKDQGTAREYDMIAQMEAVTDVRLFGERVRDDLLADWGGEGLCVTTTILRFADPVPVSIVRPWFRLHGAALGDASSVREYTLVRKRGLVLSVQVAARDTGELRTTVYQNGIFVTTCATKATAGGTPLPDSVAALLATTTPWCGHVVLHVFSAQSVAATRDRTLDLSGLFQHIPWRTTAAASDDEPDLPVFLRDVMLEPSFMLALWRGWDRQNATQVNSFWTGLMRRQRPVVRELWAGRLIAFTTKDCVVRLAELVRKMARSVTLTPFGSLNKAGAFVRLDEDHPVDTRAVSYAKRAVFVVNKLKVCNHVEAPLIVRLSCDSDTMETLESCHSEFTEQGATWHSNPIACGASRPARIFVPSDFAATVQSVQYLLQVFGYVTPEHLDKLLCNEVLKSAATRKLTQTDAVPKGEERAASVDKHISPDDPLEDRIVIDAQRESFGLADGGKFVGEASPVFEPYSCSVNEEGSVVLARLGASSERKRRGDSPPGRARQGGYGLACLMREDEDAFAPPTNPPCDASEVLPRTAAVMDDVRFKFVADGDEESLCAAVRNACFVVGRCGYVAAHEGGGRRPGTAAQLLVGVGALLSAAQGARL